MLPSRSRLTSWNPDTLSSTGPAVTSAGETVECAVGGINTNLEAMDETRSWEGPAHAAAMSAEKVATLMEKVAAEQVIVNSPRPSGEPPSTARLRAPELLECGSHAGMAEVVPFPQQRFA